MPTDEPQGVTNGGIYAIENISTGRRYVGSSCDVNRRWREHLADLGRGSHGNVRLQRTWTRYGGATFKFIVLEYITNESTLLAREQSYIDVTPKLYNICKVAGRPPKFSEYQDRDAARAKMRASHTGVPLSAACRARLSEVRKGRKLSDDHKRKLSAAKRGTKLPPMSAETIARMSAAQKGKVKSPETRARMSAAQVGKSVSSEQRARISAALTGKKQAGPSPLIGRRLSAAVRAKMAAAQRIRRQLEWEATTNARSSETSVEMPS